MLLVPGFRVGKDKWLQLASLLLSAENRTTTAAGGGLALGRDEKKVAS